MPIYLRLPGVFFLCRAWLLFSILTLQVANLWPVNSPQLQQNVIGKSIVRIGEWAGDAEMGKVCWQVFLSVWVAMLCGAFANGLERGSVWFPDMMLRC